MELLEVGDEAWREPGGTKVVEMVSVVPTVFWDGGLGVIEHGQAFAGLGAGGVDIAPGGLLGEFGAVVGAQGRTDEDQTASIGLNGGTEAFQPDEFRGWVKGATDVTSNPFDVAGNVHFGAGGVSLPVRDGLTHGDQGSDTPHGWAEEEVRA